MVSRSTRLFCVLALSLTVAACGADTGGDTENDTDAGTNASDAGTTVTTVDPSVTSTNPPNAGTDAPLNVRISATFATGMDPLSLTTATFTVQKAGAAVTGAVALSGSTATFTPAANLDASTSYTATISTGAKDATGKALGTPHAWTFVTGTSLAKGPAPVGLGAAGGFAVLAKTAISSVPGSTITGDIGLSPAAATFVTGFSLVADPTNVFATTPQVVGKVFAANYAVPSPSNLTTAVGNMESAYTDAAGRPDPDFNELGTGNLGGKTLAPGLYKWTSTVTIPTDVTIDGGANDVWIFQTTGDLVMDSAKRVTLSGGAKARNIFWQVAGQATFGANSHFEGILLSKTAATLQTDATMNGRILAQTQVALQKATVTQPTP